jgi:aminomethyltransferase
MLAVQGPGALEIAQRVLGVDDLDGLGYFRCRAFDNAGNPVLISRSGYTGEDGFEVVTEHAHATAVWDDMVAAGAIPCGLGARDTLRTEMGYCLYGHELAEDISPIEAGLKWTMDLDKAARFPGKKALRTAAAEGGTERSLIGLVLKQRAIPRPGCRIVVSDREVGQVTSGTFSPTLHKGVALAFVRDDGLEAGQPSVDIRGRLHGADIVELPFVRSSVKTRKKAKHK